MGKVIKHRLRAIGANLPNCSQCYIRQSQAYLFMPKWKKLRFQVFILAYLRLWNFLNII